MSSKGKTFTYEDRININEQEDLILQEYATLFSKLEHTLFANYCKGINLTEKKSEQLLNFGVTGRQHNACRLQLEGKIDAYKASLSFRIEQLEDKIKNLEIKLKKYKSLFLLHQKKRRLNTLKSRHAKLLAEKQEGRVRLCFGSKNLFSQQFHLKENHYNSHDEWKLKWDAARNNSFFVLGSKDETAGNQSCTATINAKGNIDLRLRLPNTHKVKYLVMENINFHNGHETVLLALKDCALRQKLSSLKDSNFKNHGQAINYRFIKDEKSWRVYISLTVAPKKIITNQNLGVIGIDINADHLALTETDRFGNPIFKQTISLSTYGKTKNQSNALIGDVATKIIALAKNKKKPIALEKLEFTKKKNVLKGENSKYARMLSSFSYDQIKVMIGSKAFREGIQLIEVNPAYTSVIGLVKFSDRYGLSKHHAAALSIGRRALGVSERLPRHLNKIPNGKGDYVALSLPVRNRDKHVWSLWGQVLKKLRVAHVVQARAVKRSLDTVKTIFATQ